MRPRHAASLALLLLAVGCASGVPSGPVSSQGVANRVYSTYGPSLKATEAMVYELMGVAGELNASGVLSDQDYERAVEWGETLEAMLNTAKAAGSAYIASGGDPVLAAANTAAFAAAEAEKLKLLARLTKKGVIK